ncbi:hypothetical protein B0H14DRAFT_2657449 [Mycena olivaceomarginata]|nr:hypothetical protein B0H14DRAFT_2657449 [Mycena olivaceomarginata]
MIREAKTERERVGWGDWWCDKVRAQEALAQYARERLPKIRRADERRAARHLYVSRMPEYALQRAAFPSAESGEPHGGQKWGHDQGWGDNAGTEAPAVWGTGEWGRTDPAWQDPGFWLTPERDNISPILVPRGLPVYLL